MSGKREYGDYQTPFHFAEKVCYYLRDRLHIKPSVIIEPTCGTGNFLKSSLLFDAKKYYGIEINPAYCDICKNTIKDDRVQIVHSDFFTFPLESLTGGENQALVIGNPPWVTNSTLSALGSENLPLKSIFKRLKGIEAITGAGNFDICESVILRLIHAYRDTDTVISMLCKTSVARNIFQELKREGISFSSCEMLEFDAAKIFGISASACVFVLRLSDKKTSAEGCNAYDFEYGKEARPQLKYQLKYANGKLCNGSDENMEGFDGHCCFEWRQGIKHDCAQIMELTVSDGAFQNGQNRKIQIESDIVFPLVKSSMFKAPIIHQFSKFVIVTQKKAREETEHLAYDAPRTWEYLNDNIKFFENRKSAVYRNAPLFSVFGVGDYSYARYKVGVSGFYKRPLFSVLYSDDKKPVMTDDTSYFICFDSFDMAYVAMLLLNSKRVQRYLTGIAFLDAKRPYTKKVLERMDFEKIAAALSVGELVQTEDELKLEHYITDSMYAAFQGLLETGQLRLA